MLKKTMAAVLALCLSLVSLSALAMEKQNPTFGTFSAENIRGEEAITEAIFAEAEVTLVNYWATWCGPCREELPDLAKLSEESEGTVQVVGVLLDGLNELRTAQDESAIEVAHVLLDDAEATFPVVIPDEWLDQVGTLVSAVPTTFLIDKDGKVLRIVEGSRSAEEWLALAEEVLGGAAK